MCAVSPPSSPPTCVHAIPLINYREFDGSANHQCTMSVNMLDPPLCMHAVIKHVEELNIDHHASSSLQRFACINHMCRFPNELHVRLPCTWLQELQLAASLDFGLGTLQCEGPLMVGDELADTLALCDDLRGPGQLADGLERQIQAVSSATDGRDVRELCFNQQSWLMLLEKLGITCVL